MRKLFSISLLLFPVFLSVSALAPSSTLAHGVVGQRFFPATIAVDDPFVADEMDLLGYSYLGHPDPADPTHNLSQTYWMGISKRLTRDLGLELTATYLKDNFDTGDLEGFDNLSVAIKYVMAKSPAHEFIMASALEFDIGGTGTRSVSDPFSTVSPTLYFGYGMGDLPESLRFLRPFAITGQAGIGIPITDGTSNGGTADYSATLKYGLTLQYSAMYLQSFVKDIGLPRPFSRVVPVVEFTSNTPLNGPSQYQGGQMYLYPGFLWIGKYSEFALEAVVPVNSITGSGTGFQAMIHLFLDDLAPQVFTRSITGEVLGPTQAQ